MLDTILAILTALFGGANILQFLFYRATKKKYEADADKASTAAAHDKLDLHQDQYDYVNAQLSKIQEEYYALADRCRKMTSDHLLEIDGKCNEIAELKSKVTYFKGLRCYRADCPTRIQESPYKDKLTATPAVKPYNAEN